MSLRVYNFGCKYLSPSKKDGVVPNKTHFQFIININRSMEWFTFPSKKPLNVDNIYTRGSGELEIGSICISDIRDSCGKKRKGNDKEKIDVFFIFIRFGANPLFSSSFAYSERREVVKTTHANFKRFLNKCGLMNNHECSCFSMDQLFGILERSEEEDTEKPKGKEPEFVGVSDSDDDDKGPKKGDNSINIRINPREALVAVKWSSETYKIPAQKCHDLVNAEYLNDDVVTIFVKEKCISESNGHVHSMDSMQMASVVNTIVPLELIKLSQGDSWILDMSESAQETFTQNCIIRMIFETTSKYIAWPIFQANGNHWYLVVIAHLHEWCSAVDKTDVPFPRIYFFDSLFHVEKNNNCKAVRHIHQAKFEEFFKPLIQFGTFLLHEDSSFLENPELLQYYDVEELFGQDNPNDCGAFVIFWVENICRGNLVEVEDRSSPLQFHWVWKNPCPFTLSEEDADKQTTNIHTIRAGYYAELKGRIVSGLEYLEQVEQMPRLAKGNKK